MADSRRAAAIKRTVDSVCRRMNDSALTRRPLKRSSNADGKRRGTKRRINNSESDDDETYVIVNWAADWSSDSDSSADELSSSPTVGGSKKRKAKPKSVQRRKDKQKSSGTKKPKIELPKTWLNLRRSSRVKDSSYSATVPVAQGLWDQRIPVEILHKIFACALLEERTVPFLTKMRKVCRLWKEAASSPHLWSIIDLEYLKYRKPEIVFSALQRYAVGIRELSISGWVRLKTAEFEKMLISTKELRALDISLCRSLDLNHLLLELIPRYCPKLISLDLSYIDPSGHKQIANILQRYLSLECGNGLEKLFLNGNAVSVMQRLSASAAIQGEPATANITVLHLSRICSNRGSIKFSLIDFVAAFPNLRALCLVDALISFTCERTTWLESVTDPWPYLYDCNIGITPGGFRSDDGLDLLIKLLGRCKNLRRLDMSGLHIRDRLLCFREVPLTYLNLTKAKEIANVYVAIELFSTWSRTLETFRMAWVSDCVDYLCEFFVAANELGLAPRLKRFDLTGTTVSPYQMKILLDSCECLEYVDLQSCRSMPLGMKRAYVGIDDVTTLREKVHQVVSDELRNEMVDI